MLPLYQIDAFAERPFTGNPAAVVVSPEPLAPETMQAIAEENNLAETAFVVPRGDGDFDLRWFTPTLEVDLCGHATLAAAYALLLRGDAAGVVRFHSASGLLTVTEEAGRLVLDFPEVPVLGPFTDDGVGAALGVEAELWEVTQVHGARYVLARVASEAEVIACAPDIGALHALDTNVIVTAEGTAFDVVSRFFAPGSGVDEDPVTGSAHCTLGPFWAERLGQTRLRCRQLSQRGGNVGVEVAGGRVRLSGCAVLYLEGRIRVG